MKFKLDENLPLELAEDLTRLGHDTDTVVSEGLAGSDDATVVRAARLSERILLTLDKGVASLIVHPKTGGIVLFRPDPSGDGTSCHSSGCGLRVCCKSISQTD